MKYLITTFLAIFLPFLLFPEGVKQLNPDSTHSTDLYIQAGSSLYSCFGHDTCDADHKLYVHIDHLGEKIYLGFSFHANPIYNHLNVELKINNSLVFGPVNIIAHSAGYIDYFSQAYAGPDVLDPSGYNSISYTPTTTGDYEIDFDIPGIPYFGLDKYDVTVIDTTITPLVPTNGRLWAKLWALNNGFYYLPTSANLGTMYVYTDDMVVTSVFFNSMQGQRYEIACNANGCYPPPVPWDSSCKSTPDKHLYPQYKIFVNNPDSVSFPSGTLGTIIGSTLSDTPACDGSFIIHFFVGKPGNVKAEFKVNPLPGIQPEDVIIMDSVHVGWNDIFWNGLNGLGQSLAGGTHVSLTLTFVNGLTNLPVYNVPRHLHGFVITLVRPPGPPVTTYWNDTLLANKGGKRQLSGCYSFDTVGCHRWNGDSFGIGIGSENTVNTWWYEPSSSTNPIILTVEKPPLTAVNISGPTIFCQSAANTYTLVPVSLFGADPNHYEWVLTDDATSAILLDLQNQDTSVTISFSPYPSGNMHLKVRGWNSICGYGTFGPGTSGEGIQLVVNSGPQITNTVTSYSICSGNTIDINLQSSLPSTTYSYTATATSGFVSGYTGGTTNPIQQTLINTGNKVDSVIYNVVPFASSCRGDTVKFYVAVAPNQSVSINISASSNPICQGAAVTFTATPTNGGVSPIYQWKVNAVNIGTNSPTYSYIPNNGDIVICILTSNALCPTGNPATSPPITMTVNPNLVVSISITSTSNPFCAGSTVTFFATPNNGGTPPSYQWKVNGINAGTNSNTYTYNPVNNDQVLCILTSSELCTSNNPASSIIITMVQNNSLPAAVSIAASSNPFCPGTSVTFTAFPIHGGPTPSYQWKVNGVNVGTNSSTYIYNPVTNDSVRCIMTSNLPCVTGSPVSSAKITMTGNLAPIVIFTSCFDTITTINAKPIKLKGGIPLGGIYSGPGVNSLTGVFTPAVAGIGSHTITYSYTNAAMCSATKSISILNLPSSILTCGNPLTDVRDNKVYQTIQIGTQCWLATNLNYGTILLSSQDQRDNCTAEKYCYNDIPTNCTNHGGLYQWDELMQFDETPADQGFCPPAWHIPTENDWNTLFATYINNGFAGSPLKYSGYSGFNALLSGARHINRGWDYQGFATFFWSSTPISNTKAWAHGMNDPDPSVSTYPALRANAFAVRCLKD